MGQRHVINSFGITIGVESDREEGFSTLADLLPPGLPSSRAVPDFLFAVTFGDSRTGQAQRIALNGRPIEEDWLASGPLLWQFETKAALLVAEHSGLVFVHAGMVGWQGRAIVLPAATMSGKSTLVASLLNEGAQYGSDEYAVFDSKGLVHAWPRRLRLRTPDGPRIADPSEYNASVVDRPLPLGTVISTRFEPGALFEPLEQSGTEGLLQLVSNAVTIRSRPRQTMSDLAKAVESARCFASSRGDATEVAQQLLSLCDGRSQTSLERILPSSIFPYFGDRP